MPTPGQDRRRQSRDAYRSAERARARLSLPITIVELADLVAAVRDGLLQNVCDHSTRFGERWAADRGIDWPALRLWLDEHGGYCDCEITYICDPREVFG
jgi:hypothetical protein